jgi:hypothetical protein
MTLFSSTAVAAPPLSADPGKVDFGTQIVGQPPLVDTRSVEITNGQNVILFPAGTYELTGDTRPFAITPAQSQCVGDGGGIYTGPTVVLGPAPAPFVACNFLIRYLGGVLPGRYTAKLTATFGSRKTTIPISVTVVAPTIP